MTPDKELRALLALGALVEERDQLRATMVRVVSQSEELERENAQLRAQLRESVARGLKLTSSVEDMTARQFELLQESRDWKDLWREHRRRASLLRRWAESVRLGRDIPAWKNQP